MKIFLVCSKNFYDRIPEVKKVLEEMGHEIYLPNYYGDKSIEQKINDMSKEEYMNFKRQMFDRSQEQINLIDSILVLNYDKVKDDVVIKNYIGGATFLEMFVAYRNNKKIYLLNEIPNNNLKDEILAFNTSILNGNLKNII
jgi:hypothetical protein